MGALEGLGGQILDTFVVSKGLRCLILDAFVESEGLRGQIPETCFGAPRGGELRP